MSAFIRSAAVAAMLCATACTSYKINYRNPAATPGATHEKNQGFFLWGLAGGSEIDLEVAVSKRGCCHW